jgi:hypothetical protein
MADVRAWAVIAPTGELTWYPLAAETEVEAIVSGERAPGALDRASVVLGAPLRLVASDVSLLFPEDYPPNPLAQRVITALSDGRIVQPWRGHVALVEYEQDDETRELLWPGKMSPQWAEAIETAVRRAQDAR